eukprot:8644510-Alexandrium_andersonii.AAC.1
MISWRPWAKSPATARTTEEPPWPSRASKAPTPGAPATLGFMMKRSSWRLRRPCMVAAPASQVLLAARSRMIMERGSGRYVARSRAPALPAGRWSPPWVASGGGSGCAGDTAACAKFWPPSHRGEGGGSHGCAGPPGTGSNSCPTGTPRGAKGAAGKRAASRS